MTEAVREAVELREGAEELGVRLEDEQVERLLAFIDRLYLWNASAGLTTVDRGLAVRRHLLDSLAAVPEVADVAELVDLGTGPGLPGIPISVVCPSLSVSLAESKRRKCSFLRETIRLLGLANCRILEGDAQALAESRDPLEAVVARAFLPPVELVRLVCRILAPGGRLVALTGSRADPAAMEAAAAGALRVTRLRNFRLPGSTERRRIIVLQRYA